MRLAVLFVVAGVALSVAAPSAQRAARTGVSTFAIAVADPSGAPVTGVKVTLTGPAQRSSTTEGGRLAFENLPAGTYHFKFERDGFETLEQDVVARGTKPIDVKVTLVPKPEPVPPPKFTPPPPPPPVAVTAKPVVLDMPAVIEKNFIGKAAGKLSPLACAGGGGAALLQINDPLSDQRHADADEFIYVIAGQGNAALAGRQEPLSPGVFLMIPRGLPHTLTRSGRNPLVMITVQAGERCAQ